MKQPIQVAQRLIQPKKILLLAGLISVSLASLGGVQRLVRAYESEETSVASALDWSGASFPVEDFLEYTSLLDIVPAVFIMA
jgi:isoaspartyl peptidase/L-asparaginase-like protein (Ntn-hydrolase superfamily)